jgi:hypothetical protein
LLGTANKFEFKKITEKAKSELKSGEKHWKLFNFSDLFLINIRSNTGAVRKTSRNLKNYICTVG